VKALALPDLRKGEADRLNLTTSEDMMERDQLRVAKPQNSGPWYDQDPAELARFRREEAARFRQGAAKARSLLGTLDGDGQRGFLFTERERLTMRMHDSERLAVRLLNLARAFESLARQGKSAGLVEGEMQRMAEAGELVVYAHDAEIERIVRAECPLAQKWRPRLWLEPNPLLDDPPNHDAWVRAFGCVLAPGERVAAIEIDLH